MKITPAQRLTGSISIPGDKSISHRAVMLASIADGVTRIENFLPGEDCLSTIRCMRQLGVEIQHSGTSVTVNGAGKNGLEAPDSPLDCGNSGTTMRLLAGILAGQDFDSALTGDDSLRSRPMGRIIDPLTQMGAAISAEGDMPPISITGGRGLKGIEYRLPVASAQIKSCVLLAGLYSKGQTTIVEPVETRDHTEKMLSMFGATPVIETTSEGKKITVSGDSKLTAHDVTVSGDVSSAAFFMVAAACIPGSNLLLRKVGINPTRIGIIDRLMLLGAKIRFERLTSDAEPTAEIRVGSGLTNAKTNKITGAAVAAVIDEIPILAVLGTQLQGGLEIRDAAELRVKETDRIAAIVENLKRMNAKVTECDDGFKVERSNLNGAKLDSFGDHRIAMAFAVAGLLATGETEIRNAECAVISFPGFFETLRSVSEPPAVAGG